MVTPYTRGACNVTEAYALYGIWHWYLSAGQRYRLWHGTVHPGVGSVEE